MFEKEKAAPKHTAEQYFLFYEIHWINKYGIRANGENALNGKEHPNIRACVRCAWQSSQNTFVQTSTTTTKRLQPTTDYDNQIFEWETDSIGNNIASKTHRISEKYDEKHVEYHNSKQIFHRIYVPKQ